MNRSFSPPNTGERTIANASGVLERIKAYSYNKGVFLERRELEPLYGKSKSIASCRKQIEMEVVKYVAPKKKKIFCINKSKWKITIAQVN